MLAELLGVQPFPIKVNKMSQIKTFGDLLTKYSNEVSPSKVCGKWEKTRLASIKMHKLGKVPLNMLSSIHISNWREMRLKTVSANTVRREWALLSNICTVAVNEWKLMSTHPMKGVKQPKAPNARDRRISNNEQTLILAELSWSPVGVPETSAQKAGYAFQFAIETALRMGEITNLKWDDVDMEKRVALIRITKMDPKERCRYPSRRSGSCRE